MEDVLLRRPSKGAKAKTYSILYVDDEEVNLRIFQYSFRKDYNVYTALNGPEAITLLEKNKIDLIITDQQMPNMTGVDLLAKIVPKYPNIVRMIMTGFSDMGAIIRAVNEFGLDRYLVKPWDREELRKVFDKALEKRNENAATEKTQDVLTNASWLNQSVTPAQSNFDVAFPSGFILHDDGENHNGYWYSTREDMSFVTFFRNSASDVVSLNVNSFIVFSLNEIIFKEKIHDPEQIIDRLWIRMIASDMENVNVEMGFLLRDQGGDLTYVGAGKSLYYYNSKGERHNIGSLKANISGGYESFDLGKDTVSEAYFLDSNLFKDQENSSDVFILNLLDEIHSKSSLQQQKDLKKKLSNYKEKLVVGMKFDI